MARESSRNSKKSNQTSGGTFLRPQARVLVALIVIGLLGWGAHALWQQFGPLVIQQDNHLLAANRITVSTLPAWVSSDFLHEVTLDAGLDGRLSLLDDSFPQVIEDAFTLHPWVESVARIEKRYPKGVHVDLVYRVPVAVVEMSGKEGVLFLPVDKHAVHLPSKGFPELRRRYLPRIGGIVARPPTGQVWPDPRVVGAAQLAEKLKSVWEQLHLVDILPSARPEIRDDHRYFVYDLITRGGTRVVWGAAPEAAPPDEPEFDAKLSRLRECVDQHGPLNSVHSPAVVDVRRELAITPRTVKKTSPRTVKKPASVNEETNLVK